MALTPEQLDVLRRNSRLRIDREGRWWLDRRLVENDKVQVLFHQCLSVDAETGQHKLTVGSQWAYVQFVDDTAWFVKRVHLVEPNIILTLADGSQEPLEPATLSMSSPTDLYCVLSGGRRARFLREGLIDLAPYLQETEDGLGLRAAGSLYAISEE